jgi:hypothetical protein
VVSDEGGREGGRERAHCFFNMWRVCLLTLFDLSFYFYRVCVYIQANETSSPKASSLAIFAYEQSYAILLAIFFVKEK